MKWILSYLIIINLITFYIYGFDKRRAKKKERRVPEKTLLMLTAIGGSVGAILGMYIFRHKIKKPKFYLSVPLLLVLHIIIFCFFFLR